MDPVAAAKAYISDKLGVEFSEEGKSELLNKIIRAFFEKVPFQNISTGILPPEERFPSEQVVVENGTSLKGGLNVHNNWFFKMLLEALGYDVAFVAATIEYPPAMSPRISGGHFAILIQNLENPGDLHLVDVGSGFPVFKAVPLKELPFTATDVYLTYRFVEEDGMWHSEHKDPEGETWTRFVSYDKTAVKENPDQVFKDPVLDLLREDWLVGGIVAVHYPQPGSAAIPDIPEFNKDCDYVVGIKHNVITFRNSAGLNQEEIVPEDQTVATICTYFPNIPKNEVEKKLEMLYEEAALMRY